MQNILQESLLGRPASDWIAASAALCVIAFGVPVVRGIIRRRAGEVKNTPRTVRELVAALNARWLRLTTLVIAAAVAAFMLRPDERLGTVVRIALIVVLSVQLIRLFPVVIDWVIARLSGVERTEDASRSLTGTLTGLRWLVMLVVYSVILLLALQNMGINVTAMIAGLGVGGIAVALAVQNILGDLFGSLTIALDRPFVVGDFIVVGSEMGTVEHVGLKTTRVRSLSGEQLVFSNSDLLASRIRNFKRMKERRVVFGFGVVYGTGPEKLRTASAIVRAAVEAQKTARFDRCHFFRFGTSSLDFEVVYYVDSPDFNAYMDVQQAIHLAIVDEFRKAGITFALPAQVLHVSRRPRTREEDSANAA